MGDTLKLHDLCHNPEGICQIQITFTPRNFQIEGAGFKNTIENFSEGTEKMWNKFIRPALKIASPLFSAGVSAKTRNPQAAEITSNILKFLTGGKNLSLTDMYVNGLRLKVK